MTADNGKESENLRKVKKYYKEFSQIPEIESAHILKLNTNSELTVIGIWSQINLAELVKKQFQTQTYVTLNSEDKIEFKNSFPSSHDCQLFSIAPSGKFRAEISTRKTEKSINQQYLFIYDRFSCSESFNITKFHEFIITNSFFARLSWSPDENRLAYVAEKKRPKNYAYFEELTEKADSSGEPGHEYDYIDNWKEGISDCSQSLIFIYNRAERSVTPIEIIPENYCGALPVWVDNYSLACVAYLSQPWRLGLKYCFNRTSFIYHVAINGSFCTKISDEGKFAFEPCFSPKYSYLVYIDFPSGGSHKTDGRLVCIDWKSRAKSIILDTSMSNSLFPGLYTYRLANKCFSSCETKLFFESSVKSLRHIFAVDLKTSKIENLTSSYPGSWSVLDVNYNIIIASYSAPNVPHKIMLSVFKEGVPFSWQEISGGNYNDYLENLIWEIKEFTSKDNANEKYEGVVIKDSKLTISDTKPPLIIIPHGGPHSVYVSDFNLSVCTLASLGFLVVLANYRGSIGFGRDTMEKLIGNIGRMDVDDTHSITQYMIANEYCDPNNIGVSGGSHGGFIAAHLIGQFPDTYKSAVMRNPVINLATCVGVNDIPDWCYHICNLEYSPSESVTSHQLNVMLNMSPIIYSKNTKASILLMLGSEDKRVPNSQGLEYYKVLKAQGKEVSLKLYPNTGHSLDDYFKAELDGLINSALFFMKTLIVT